MSDRKTAQSESIKLAIREAGLRATPARIATLRLLHEATSPMTHAEVAEELHRTGGSSLAVRTNFWRRWSRGGTSSFCLCRLRHCFLHGWD